MERIYHILGACSCWGAQIRACELGPEDLVEARIFERLKQEGIALEEVELLYPSKSAKEQNLPLDHSLRMIHEFNLRLARSVLRVLEADRCPVVVGGDHSIAVGTWNGVRRYLLESSPLPMGLLWIDAHMDAHTPETSPSGAWHGMPVASLLGKGDPLMAELLQKEPILTPDKLVYIGVRDFEPEEKALLTSLNVRVYYIDEVKSKGMKTVLKEALQIVTNGTSGFGLSLDLDAIDPVEMPAVGSPVPGGISAKELLKALPLISKSDQLKAIEIVEYNPERDVDHKSRELLFEFAKDLLR